MLFGRRNFAFLLMTVAITIYPILSTTVDIQRNRWSEISQPGVEETISEYLLDNQQENQLVAAVVPASTQIKFYYSQKANYKTRFYDTARQQPFDNLLVVVDKKDDHTIESVLDRNKLLGQVDWLNAEPVYEYKRITIYKVNRIMEVP
jgi:hypothetical protein